MRKNTFRELLSAGKPTIGTHIHSTWPSVVEAVGHAGMFDYIEFVAEYGPYDLHDLDNICRAAELHNLSSMIKVDQVPRQFVAQRAIGSGRLNAQRAIGVGRLGAYLISVDRFSARA